MSTTAQVRWFGINPDLSNDELADMLAPDVTHENGEPPLLFFQNGKSVGCRADRAHLKINLGAAAEILQSAGKIGDCLGES